MNNSIAPVGSKPISSSEKFDLRFLSPLYLDATSLIVFSGPKVFQSSKSSEGEPKHTKPAFLVLPPPQNGLSSIIVMLASGKRLLDSRAAESPTKPAPTTIISRPWHHPLCSQKLKSVFLPSLGTILFLNTP